MFERDSFRQTGISARSINISVISKISGQEELYGTPSWGLKGERVGMAIKVIHIFHKAPKRGLFPENV